VVGADQGIVRVFRDDLPAGEAVNLYAAERALSPVLPFGVFEMRAGDNFLFLHLTGKDPRSTGVSFELVEIVLEKQ